MALMKKPGSNSKLMMFGFRQHGAAAIVQKLHGLRNISYSKRYSITPGNDPPLQVEFGICASHRGDISNTSTGCRPEMLKLTPHELKKCRVCGCAATPLQSRYMS